MEEFIEDSGYIRTADRKKFAASIVQRLTEEEGRELHPAVAHGKKIAEKFWGYAWCRNIERYQDYASRLPMGRSLLRSGGVIDLIVSPGEICALTVSDRLYRVRIRIRHPEEEILDALRNCCSGKIGTLMDLLNGELSDDLLHVLCEPETGLFPQPDELKFICECLDDSCLCRHAAAVLYAVGARLDDEPELFFTLRGIDKSVFFDPVQASGLAGNADTDDMDFSAEELSETFGIELDN